MNRRTFISGSVAALAALSGCASSDDQPRQEGDANPTEEPTDTQEPTDEPTETATETATPTPESEVKILNHEFYEDAYSAGVEGVLQNQTDSELSYVEVSVYFLNEDGVQIGEGLDNTNDLAANRKWQFDAMMYDGEPENVDTYEIEASVSDF